MSSFDIPTVLTSDRRFTKCGVKFQANCEELSNVFCQESVVNKLKGSISCLKNAVFFLNVLQYANKKKDALALDTFDETQILQILSEGIFSAVEYVDLTESELKDALKSDYLDYRDANVDIQIDRKAEFINKLVAQNQFEDYQQSIEVPAIVHEANFSDVFYWTNAVRLDFPYIPQPDGTNIVSQFTHNSQQYCMYGESTLPWNQSQITSLTDVNRFSDKDILNLFPPVRLYTRSPYMYKKYDGLEFDEDLGVILKIKGFNKNQIKKNIIEYPHITNLDRWVKSKGEYITIPFWKHVEIDGQMYSTSSVWDSLTDTKNLPKTESFMNEYVVRKYLLERDKGIEHNYPMRGDLSPFLTLYAPPSYYEAHKYNPVEVGRKCVVSRTEFKKSRNPVLSLISS